MRVTRDLLVFPRKLSAKVSHCIYKCRHNMAQSCVRTYTCTRVLFTLPSYPQMSFGVIDSVVGNDARCTRWEDMQQMN